MFFSSSLRFSDSESDGYLYSNTDWDLITLASFDIDSDPDSVTLIQYLTLSLTQIILHLICVTPSPTLTFFLTLTPALILIWTVRLFLR